MSKAAFFFAVDFSRLYHSSLNSDLVEIPEDKSSKSDKAVEKWGELTQPQTGNISFVTHWGIFLHGSFRLYHIFNYIHFSVTCRIINQRTVKKNILLCVSLTNFRVMAPGQRPLALFTSNYLSPCWRPGNRWQHLPALLPPPSPLDKPRETGTCDEILLYFVRSHPIKGPCLSVTKSCVFLRAEKKN